MTGFSFSGRLATFSLCNEADLSSLALRLAGSPHEASPAELLRRTLDWLPDERAIIRVTSFQVTRTARLGLAHQITQMGEGPEVSKGLIRALIFHEVCTGVVAVDPPRFQPLSDKHLYY